MIWFFDSSGNLCYPSQVFDPLTIWFWLCFWLFQFAGSYLAFFIFSIIDSAKSSSEQLPDNSPEFQLSSGTHPYFYFIVSNNYGNFWIEGLKYPPFGISASTLNYSELIIVVSLILPWCLSSHCWVIESYTHWLLMLVFQLWPLTLEHSCSCLYNNDTRFGESKVVPVVRVYYPYLVSFDNFVLNPFLNINIIDCEVVTNRYTIDTIN